MEAAEVDLVRWADANGIRRKIVPYTFGGGLRGAAAQQDVTEGEAVVSVPESLLITVEYAKRSDFGLALQRLPIDDQSLLLLWTMADRHDTESHLAPFWRALPPQITTGKRVQCGADLQLSSACLSDGLKRCMHSTGLGFDTSALALLKGMPVHAECVHAAQHVRAAYEDLRAVITALLQAYPQHLKEDWFTLDAFLWAVHIWTAYSLQVRHTVDGRTTKREAMVPIACLMNHNAAAPHIRQYGQLQDGWLHFPASRAISEGEQVHLHYGSYDNAHLLVFYGFVLPNNPNDSVTITIKVKPDARAEKVHAALARLQLPLEYPITRTGPLEPVLTCLTVVHAGAAQLDSLTTMEDCQTCSGEEPLQHLKTTLAIMKQCHERCRSRSMGDAASVQLAHAYINERFAILESAAELAARSCHLTPHG